MKKKIVTLVLVVACMLMACGKTVKNDDTALAAVKSYCYENYPDIKEAESMVYWNIESSDDKQIVVLFRSYTGALVRFYIDSASGDTYITEYVDGITPEEEETGETFNIKEYM
ncbi:hypothetical protein SAMN04487830_1404 [Pseudobutyrivibrio sp. OR37]|uniref:hypothetical protein n=1 Tax=Pseudobutyrivibrio sp. OR37 TaxID=1798186 RepID=UPI0008E0509B|nr:hypothetical protein [Pseudobutyrivibrio sp. OR37]SFI30635.1 hypothetical protein SAMN04487830_1404 [Pseudobutyrivibrio sp. OR37]